MPTPTLKLLYNPGEYIPYPIAPEGVPTVADTATMKDLSPEIKALLKRNEQKIKERNQREYEEHRRKTDVRFTGEKPLQTEDHLFAGALIGGSGIKQGLRFLKSHPLLRAGLDVYGAGDGIVNLFTGNGVQKTYRLAKEGDTWGALKSGTGDVLNLLGTTDLIRIGSKFNRANRALHALDVIEPTDYRRPVKRGLQWMSDIITDKPVDLDNLQWRTNPKYSVDKVGETYLLRDDPKVHTARVDATDAEKALANEIALNAREDALRMYLGFPQKYDTYVPNGDGTFSYNIEKLKESGFDFEGFGQDYDYLTSNAGNWKSKGVRDIATDGVNTSSIHSVEDIWDLNPFQNSKIPFLRKIEAGKIIGGKPFKLNMDIPFTSTPYGPVLGHKINPLKELQGTIKPSSQQLKFVDDVTKGARIARTTSEKPIGELIDYTDDLIDGTLPVVKRLGDGYESQVFLGNNGEALKFSTGRRVSRVGDRMEVGDIDYRSKDEMLEGAKRQLAEWNKYWYAEPHSLNGYYNMIDADGRLRWYPVYSQTEMASTIADVPFRTPYSTYGKPRWYLANKAREQALFDVNPEAKYIMKDVVKNNIFSENDLLEPLDTHIGNFMYGKDGVLRATDIHKLGGKIK